MALCRTQCSWFKRTRSSYSGGGGGRSDGDGQCPRPRRSNVLVAIVSLFMVITVVVLVPAKRVIDSPSLLFSRSFPSSFPRLAEMMKTTTMTTTTTSPSSSLRRHRVVEKASSEADTTATTSSSTTTTTTASTSASPLPKDKIIINNSDSNNNNNQLTPAGTARTADIDESNDGIHRDISDGSGNDKLGDKISTINSGDDVPSKTTTTTTNDVTTDSQNDDEQQPKEEDDASDSNIEKDEEEEEEEDDTPKGLSFTRTMDTVPPSSEGAVLVLNLDPGHCATRDAYGDNSCHYSWGDDVNGNYTAQYRDDIQSDDYIRGEFKINRFIPYSFDCYLCGRDCELKLPVLKKEIVVHMPEECPIRTSSGYDGSFHGQIWDSSPTDGLWKATVHGVVTVVQGKTGRTLAQLTIDGSIR